VVIRVRTADAVRPARPWVETGDVVAFGPRIGDHNCATDARRSRRGNQSVSLAGAHDRPQPTVAEENAHPGTPAWRLPGPAAWGLVIYYLAVARRLPEEDVDRYVAEVYPPPID
jgi:hypothetical protein